MFFIKNCPNLNNGSHYLFFPSYIFLKSRNLIAAKICYCYLQYFWWRYPILIFTQVWGLEYLMKRLILLVSDSASRSSVFMLNCFAVTTLFFFLKGARYVNKEHIKFILEKLLQCLIQTKFNIHWLATYCSNNPGY